MIEKRIAELVRSERTSRRMTVKALAELMGVNRRVVFDIERGENSVYSIRHLIKIEEIFNIEFLCQLERKKQNQ